MNTLGGFIGSAALALTGTTGFPAVGSTVLNKEFRDSFVPATFARFNDASSTWQSKSGSIDPLVNVILKHFKDAGINACTFTDPEEGGSSAQLIVQSPFTNLDEHFIAEDAFYAEAESNPALMFALRQTIVTFK
jgi:hypothetical protein